MIHLRVGDREISFPETSWEAWVSEGRVPPDALVFSLDLTGGRWIRAERAPLYGFFRKTGEEDRREAGRTADTQAPFTEILQVAFPRRGLSYTEILLGLNLAVAVLLLLLWQTEYSTRLFGSGPPAQSGAGLAWDFYRLFTERRIPIGFLATLFIHADVRHLLANMLSLTAAAAFVEHLYGRWVGPLYLIGGLVGAVASFLLKGRGPMSVGASGAVYALIGVFVAFVLRYYGQLPRWHRWKARRVYVPLLALAILPSILHADWRAHVGGFVSGVLLGLVLPLSARGRRLLLH
jgi:membrane associated rhomboid family serine protease